MRIRRRSAIRAIVRRAPIIVAGAVLISLVASVLLTMRNDDRAEVRALVVAQELTVGVDELSASVSTIYRFGGVAEAAIAEGSLDVTPEVLRGDLVDVVVVASTPVIQVVGRHADPARAAQHANAVAAALATALSDAGGIGTFAVVERADPARADDPANVPVLLFAVVVGLLSIVALAVGFVMWVRPMFTAEELAEVSASPLVMGIDRSPDDVQRLADTLARQHPTWLMVHLDSDDEDRLLPLVREARPELDVGTSPLDKVAMDRRDQPNSLVVVVVPAGAGLGAVRRAEAVAGRQLAATVMVS